MPQLIQRYTAPERVNHWVVAASFVLLTPFRSGAFQPEFFVLSWALGGGTWSRILHPSHQKADVEFGRTMIKF